MNQLQISAFTGIILLSLYLLLRNRRMAALFSWMYRIILGTRARSEPTRPPPSPPAIAENKQSIPTTKSQQSKNKTTKLKTRSKRSTGNRPTPIEDILVEPLNDEQNTPTLLPPGQILKKATKNKKKSTKSSKNDQSNKSIKKEQSSGSVSSSPTASSSSSSIVIIYPFKKNPSNNQSRTVKDFNKLSSSSSSSIVCINSVTKQNITADKEKISKDTITTQRIEDNSKINSTQNKTKEIETNLTSTSEASAQPQLSKPSKKVTFGLTYANIVTNKFKTVTDNIKNLSNDQIKSETEIDSRIVDSSANSNLDRYLVEDHFKVDKKQVEEEKLIQSSDTRSVELFGNADSERKRQNLLERAFSGDFNDLVEDLEENCIVIEEGKTAAEVINEINRKYESEAGADLIELEHEFNDFLDLEVEDFVLVEEAKTPLDINTIYKTGADINESNDHFSIRSIEKLNRSAEEIEEEIQDLEDRILEKPYVIEKSEILVDNIQQLSRKITDNDSLIFVEDHYRKDSFFDSEKVQENSEIHLNIELQDLENKIIKEIAICTNEQETIEKMPSEIRILTLNDKEHQNSTVYRIEKDFILQFRLGSTLLGRKIKLYSNYPKEINGKLEEFNRQTYQLLNWCQDEGCKNADDTALSAQIVAKLSGSFHYYFLYDDETNLENRNADQQGSGYFLIDPVLTYGKNNEKLPLDCIQCQTVLAKHLGPFSTWEKKLIVAKKSGYNMIHFTPIQQLGASNSSYSLREQLKLNPLFNGDSQKVTFKDVEKLTEKLRKEWNMLSICDIVLNHTANESDWIEEHPEVTYNCLNCPYMRPAYLLDAAFNQFAMTVKNGDYINLGIPSLITNEDHLNAIRHHFKTNVLDKLKIYELFTIDVNKYTEEFQALLRKTPPAACNEKLNRDDLKIIQDPEYRRLQSTIDLDLALKMFNIYRLDSFDEETRVKKCSEEFRNLIEKLNAEIVEEINIDLNIAIENVISGIRYTRLQSDGPKFTDITIEHPLIYRYFTDYGSPTTIEECEMTMYNDNSKFLMAHNGWVMNSNPLENFAAFGSKTYFRRELIAWGDSVKLRYGSKPDDCPFLWQHMRTYVEQTAKIFDGVRLDNCHSTPLPVAEYLLDCARKIRPDLYVVAELFTNSDLTDNIFVNRLGITSLIREAMSAWDPHEQGRLVYRYGGCPVGSFYQPNIRPLAPMVAHALFLDLTHDNPSPVEKRSVFDLLPSTALVNMACCASGSNRGYDELVPHHIHVVEETRQYTEWSDNIAIGKINEKFGIIAAKKALNDLHFLLGKEGFNQVYVDQIDGDIIAVTRHNPINHNSYVLVAFTAFNHPDSNAANYQRDIKPLRIEGVLDEIVLEAFLSHNDEIDSARFAKAIKYEKDPQWINGLAEYRVSLKQHIEIKKSNFFELVNSGTDNNVIQLNFKNFKPGSIAVIKISLPEDMQKSIKKIRELTEEFSSKKDTELKKIIRKMDLADLNRALYRCGEEERDEGFGFDVYNIPNYGQLVFCGFQGIMSVLANIRSNNDLGHPICANLRDGNWLIEYIWKRLNLDEGTNNLGNWIKENVNNLNNIPRYLIPCYFDVIVTGIYMLLLEQCYNSMSDFVKNGSTFVKSLSLGSVQFAAYIKSSQLPTLSPDLAPPKPPSRKNSKGELVQACPTLSAGLPFFSVGYMRNWGRDTFIAIRGLFILTGRYTDARQHILGYAACLRHGLIPNLLDGGKNARYNCRDAVWWWLYIIKAYCIEAPNGHSLLSDRVSRIFPTDDSDAQSAGVHDQPLYEVIQEALIKHFQGLIFTERNAGKQIDEQMSKQGFNNQIGIHPETGFVFGGNRWNCGTWMDKMGSSEKAGNKGEPATPRDGSAIELIGLSKAVVSWLAHLHQKGFYPYDGVERVQKTTNETIKWTFTEWAEKIQENFERKFYIDSESSQNYDGATDLINKHFIYKDTFGSSIAWADYQLRCNFPIAMVTAPELFDAKHAWAALNTVEKYLLGPLGMRTLDPEDWRYRGDYFNSNDSNDYHTAHGFNYHQGPEWIWPMGYYLRARLIFAAQNGKLKETVASTKVILSRHFTELQTSPWRGLPELTNSNGSYCADSSRTQAWSMSCILEVLYDLQQIESRLLN